MRLAADEVTRLLNDDHSAASCTILFDRLRRSYNAGHTGRIDAAANLLVDVFADVPHVMVCVKGPDGRYTAVNQSFVRRARRHHPHEVIGRRAGDLFPADLAASYEAQDRSLLRTGHTVRNQLEVIPGPSGAASWYLTTKVLHREPHDQPMIVVVSVEAQLGRGATADGLRAAIEFVHGHAGEAITVADLTRAAKMSADSLERAMGRALGISPKQYVLRARAELAATMLATTTRPLSAVAAQCGYYDQSQFTRQFKAHTGLTPGQYRGTQSASADG
jgi:AraC-like DNA-binding protein